MISATALLLLVPIGGILAAIGPVTDLHIQNAFLQPDGFNRSFVTAEGTIPGPLITGNIGDNFQINVIDELTNDTMLLSTSIHWHGLFQATTSWADGPSFVNQCPIAANNSFLYDFNVPGQAGTFWYHSHLATQYCDGLRGALVIYDPNDPYLNEYDVDDDSTVITLSDHYHVPAGLIVGAAKSDATLINGLGRAFVTGPADAPLAVVAVTQGLRYRFRLVSISCDPSYVFSIDQHTFSFIEVDGVLHEAVTADSVQIFAAQRYSFILTANQTVDNYWIKADPETTPGSGFANGINSAILRYAGAPVAEPTSVDFPINQLSETSLHPLVNPGAPGEDNVNGAQHPLNLVLGFSRTTGRFEINGVSFVPPSVPVLLQIISGTLDAADLLPAGSVYELPLNSSIQLSFDTSAAVGGPHPFHLHGHNFDVIRPAGSTEYNYVNPVRRDVVSTGNTLAGDNVTIRFTTDNAGPWFLHCHIDFHLEAGFAIVFAEGINSIAAPAAAKPPQDWDQLCPIYNNLTTAQLGGGGGPTT